MLEGKKGFTSFDNEGVNQVGESIALKLIDTTSNSIEERINVRLVGVPYEKFVNQNEWDRYNKTDDYYLLYEGEKESKMNIGFKYQRIYVLHRKRGKKQFRAEGGTTGPLSKRRKNNK